MIDPEMEIWCPHQETAGILAMLAQSGQLKVKPEMGCLYCNGTGRVKIGKIAEVFAIKPDQANPFQVSPIGRPTAPAGVRFVQRRPLGG